MTVAMGTIFDIQRFCLHDGPGIRTTVFLKGCPLRCVWCSNPESQETRPQIMFSRDRCMNCGSCAAVCPVGLPPSGGGYRKAQCSLCGSCADTCPTEALLLKGRSITAPQLLKELIRDVSVFRSSGGGVTFSGGEPLMQADFLRESLILCKEAGLDTCIETTCCVSRETIERCVPYISHFLCDIKNPISDRHRTFTGVPCEEILENTARLIASGADVTVRIPVIPGFNTDPDSHGAFISYFTRCGPKQIELLPYHIYGEKKYELLGRAYPGAGIPAEQAQECAQALCRSLREAGFQAGISG